jgi:beta-lactamase class A
MRPSRFAPATPSLDEKLVLTKDNQVPGSGVIGQLTAPLTLNLRDVLHLMVVLSDNTATNLAIDRLGLAHINATLRAAGLKQTVLYKKVYKPAGGAPCRPTSRSSAWARRRRGRWPPSWSVWPSAG